MSPSAVNIRDLEAMVQFIHTHPLVAQKLKSIDLISLTIFFGNDCEARFERKGKRIKWLILPLHESETDRHLIGLSG